MNGILSLFSFCVVSSAADQFVGRGDGPLETIGLTGLLGL